MTIRSRALARLPRLREIKHLRSVAAGLAAILIGGPSLAAPSFAAPSFAAPSFAAPSFAAPSFAAPSWVVGADPAPNPLNRTIVDVATLPPTVGAAGIERERLLTLQAGPDGTAGSSRVAILEHAEGRWTEVAALIVEGAGPRWFVDAGGGIFAIVSASSEPGDAGASIVTTVAVGRDSIGLRRVARLDVPLTAGGAADVNGDGSPEIVLAGRADRRRLGVCLGTRIVTLDPATLREGGLELRELEFDGAVIGEFDGLPGAELVGLTRCDVPGASPTNPRPVRPRVVGVRLVDGSISFALPVGERDADLIRPADLDGDGTDELLISSASGPLAVDPGRLDARGVPATRLLADEPSFLPLFAAGGSPSRPPAVVVAGDSDLRIIIGPIVPAAVEAEPTTATQRAGLSGPRWTAVVADRLRTVARREPPVGLWADLDADRCPDLLMPGFMVACRDPIVPEAPPPNSDFVIQRGPVWTAARPLATVGRGSAMRLLVAQAVGPTDLAALRAPTPSVAWAGDGGSGWRTGPSGPFVLSELSLPDLLYFPVYPVPEPTMEGRAVGRPAVVQASGWSGTDYLVRVVALDDDDREPTAAPGLGEFLAGFASGAAGASQATAQRVVRIDVRAGHPAGADTAVATIPLDDVRTASGTQPRRWVVTFVAFNAWGEVSMPVMRVVTRDLAGPPLTIAAPFASLPWPFSAQIGGVAEPGATVQVNGAELLATTSRGVFETRVTLAPWPQDVRIRAADETGNVTVRVISMMGGLDVRQLPWQVIVAILVLVAVLAGTIREGRRAQTRLVASDRRSAGLVGAQVGPRGRTGRRDGRWLTDERDDLPLPEIEEIPPSVR